MKKTIILVAIILIAAICLFGCKDTPETFTVTWVNYDGTVLETDENVAKGATPEYNGDVPTRASDETYNYAFSGWSPEIGPIEGNQTYTATFTSTEKNAGDETGGETGGTGGGTGGTGGETGGETGDGSGTGGTGGDTGGGTGDGTGDGTGGDGGGTTPSNQAPDYIFMEEEDATGYLLLAYLGDDENVTIPSTYNEKPVTKLGYEAFAGNTTLKSITLPDSLTYMDYLVFMGCTALNSVTFGTGLEEINAFAFAQCESLTTVNLPSSIKNIVYKAFHGCSNLTNVTIPDSIEKVDSMAFAGCVALTYKEYENGKYLGNATNEHLVLMEVIDPTKTTFTVHNNCKVLADSIFGFADFISITLGNSLKSISDEAFWQCPNLASITIPDSVLSIGGEAFYDCGELKEVTLGSGVTRIENYAFESCIKLDTINIPEGVTYIGENAFRDCESLATIKLPDTITYISKNTFSKNNSPLMALVYTEDSGNKYLGNDTNPYLVFMEAATGSTSITVKDGCKVIADMAFLGMSSLNSVTFPEGLTHICKDALKLCENLNTKITIPESVVSIGAGAFVGCVSLTEIEVAEGNSVYKSQDNCIIEKATNKLVAVPANILAIPSGVAIIGERVFEYA